MPSPVTVSIVNYNHLRYLPACLDALRAQSLQPEEIVVLDNASVDGSPEWLRKHAGDVRIILNSRNTGYAGGHNRIFRTLRTRYVLALNCDVVLDRDFLSRVIAALDRVPRAGSACGRLYRGKRGETEILDSTGLFPDRFRRFHDRDHDMPDRGQRRIPSRIFGPSGSAAAYRLSMLEDVAFEEEYFDESFFAYCEDADLAWRAQRLGWSSVLVPDALGWHVHDDLSRARSGKRGGDASLRQLLLIRNRHLCFLKNDGLVEIARDLPWLLGYDLALEIYLLARKPRLAVRWPAAVAASLTQTGRKRTALMTRQRRAVRLSTWFDPDADPACE